MNILMLSWRGPGHPHFGGAEINTLENVTAWAKAGHQVVWFTSSFQRSSPSEIVNGVEIIRRGSQNFEVHIAAFWWYLFKTHPKFDIVVDQFHGIPFFTPLFARIPKLAFIHEVAREVWRLNPWPFPFNLIPSVLGSIIEPLTFLPYRKIPFMTVSNSTKADLIEYGIPKENISVFLSGVNLNLPSPIPPKNTKPTVMFLGALSKDKGTEDAIKTFSIVCRTRPSWQFWVVGKSDPEYLLQLKYQVKSLDISHKVKFWGPIYEREKFKLLARSHVLINPSIREGWGLVNIEANSVATPVVGYNVPGTRDSVKNGVTGLLVPAHHPELLAQMIIELVENKPRYEKFQTNCKRWSKQFSWSKFTKQSLALLGRLTRQND